MAHGTQDYHAEKAIRSSEIRGVSRESLSFLYLVGKGDEWGTDGVISLAVDDFLRISPPPPRLGVDLWNLLVFGYGRRSQRRHYGIIFVFLRLYDPTPPHYQMRQSSRGWWRRSQKKETIQSETPVDNR